MTSFVLPKPHFAPVQKWVCLLLQLPNNNSAVIDQLAEFANSFRSYSSVNMNEQWTFEIRCLVKRFPVTYRSFWTDYFRAVANKLPCVSTWPFPSGNGPWPTASCVQWVNALECTRTIQSRKVSDRVTLVSRALAPLKAMAHATAAVTRDTWPGECCHCERENVVWKSAAELFITEERTELFQEECT